MRNTSATPHVCYSGVETILECGGSYAGYCNTTTGSCVCRSGWSGRSDYWTMDLREYGGRVLDCQVNLRAIQILNAIVFVNGIVCSAIHAFILRQTWRLYRKRKANKVRLMWWSFAPLQVQILVVILFLAQALVGALKATDPEGTHALLGIHLPASLAGLLFIWLIPPIGAIHLMSRRKTLLAKALFLGGEEASAIQSKLSRSWRRVIALALITELAPLCFYPILVAFKPLEDDKMLPFSGGRFLLFPGAILAMVVVLLVFSNEYRQDLVLINSLFAKLSGMVNTSVTPGVRRKVSVRSATTQTRLQEAHLSLQEHYAAIRQGLHVLAASFGILVVVPPLWTRWGWVSPFCFLYPTMLVFKASAQQTPSAYGGVVARHLRLSLVRHGPVRSSSVGTIEEEREGEMGQDEATRMAATSDSPSES